MPDGSPTPVTGQARFVDRHTGLDPAGTARVLATLGLEGLEELADAVVPASLPVLPPPAPAPAEPAPALDEAGVIAAMRAAAAANDPHVEMIGAGYHPCHTPAVIARDVLANPAWTTAYTPYQAEISQGRLEAQLLFQTAVADLTGLPVASASLLDEATAVAEAVLLIARAQGARSAGEPILLDAGLHPQCLEVTLARTRALGTPTLVAPAEVLTDGAALDALLAGARSTTAAAATSDDGAAPARLLGAVLAQATTRGALRDLAPLVAAVHELGGLAAVDTDPLALTLLTPPGEVGADIAVGSAQRLGVPVFLGGPHAGYMAVTERLGRRLPGRIVGVSRDADGTPAYRLALQTREQHIRREKATSNICTAQALLAVVAAMYCVHHGPEGLVAIASHVHERAAELAARLTDAGLRLEHEEFFDTLAVSVPGRAAGVVARAAATGVNLRLLDADTVGISTNETTTPAHLDTVVAAFTGAGDGGGPARAGTGPGDITPAAASAHQFFPVPARLARTSTFLTHPTFHAHRSEASLVRYLRRLADRDLALDRTMIPLGSCTLKLNAAVESAAWLEPGLAGIHPLAPADQTRGWRRLLAGLADRLARVTGYDAVSLQPASGAQGELTGLLAIRAFHDSQAPDGRSKRDVCLVPASAHGTNAASAAGAGLRVAVVATADDGSIDLVSLTARLAEHEGRVAAVMLTYPSTHGVFEPQVSEVCHLVHAAGGQVYIDGANLNALCGLLRPGDLGGDVSHLNLHKTFAVPHGGGGPGVGPVAAKAHLAPFLPAGPPGSAAPEPGDPDTGFGGAPVAGARFGSAGVMPLSWAYLALMDDADLRRASLGAVAAANYLARRLAPSFPTLYTGPGGWVAHECILDLRPLTAATGVSAEDVAKRLVDLGFHAPTLSFPVAGTLMVEPTESEPLEELDRFVEAMEVIRAEIEDVAAGRIAVEDSPLRLAPHTAAQVCADHWERAYPRSQAAFPSGGPRTDKYFPPVTRIDNAWGDRHLVCTCPPPEAFDETPARHEEHRP